MKDDISNIYSSVVDKLKKYQRIIKVYEDPENFVNQAWLSLTEAGLEVNFNTLFLKSKSLSLSHLTENNTSAPPDRSLTRTCAKCKEDLPIGMFYLGFCKKLKRKRVSSYCKVCTNVTYKKWSKDNKAKVVDYRREYNLKLSDTLIKQILKRKGYSYTSKEMIEKTRIRILRWRIESG